MAVTLRTRTDHSKVRRLPTPKSTLITHNRNAASWRDGRFWAGLGLLVGSVVIGNSYVAHVSARSFAVVLDHPLAAGTVISRDDLRLASVALPDSVEVVKSVSDAVGHAVSHDVQANELLLASALTVPTVSDIRIVAIPIRAGHMPSVTHGSRVDVWVTPSTQGLALPGPAELVVAGALVQAVPDQIDPASDTSLALSISQSDVAALMQGLRDGLIDVVAVPSAGV
ncbi:MAG: SAF domain-containing protein [Actinomycetes bacterium]